VVRTDDDPAELTAERTLIDYRGEQPADTARRTGQIEASRLLEATPDAC
jgi:hypothetical protein